MPDSGRTSAKFLLRSPVLLSALACAAVLMGAGVAVAARGDDRGGLLFFGLSLPAVGVASLAAAGFRRTAGGLAFLIGMALGSVGAVIGAWSDEPFFYFGTLLQFLLAGMGVIELARGAPWRTPPPPRARLVGFLVPLLLASLMYLGFFQRSAALLAGEHRLQRARSDSLVTLRRSTLSVPAETAAASAGAPPGPAAAPDPVSVSMPDARLGDSTLITLRFHFTDYRQGLTSFEVYLPPDSTPIVLDARAEAPYVEDAAADVQRSFRHLYPA